MLAACSRVSMENYQKLKTGMNYEEVQTILGSPSNCSEVLLVKQCVWGDEHTGISANFVADRMITSSANNLH